MAKSEASESRNSMLHLKHVVEKLQGSLSSKGSAMAFVARDDSDDDGEEFDGVGSHGMVPEDVKEGHFAVFAMNDGQPKRFVVSLGYLRHPQFLRLLEEAAEEFGFGRKGPLAIPCRPSGLERILGEHWKEEKDGDGGDGWDGCNTMVESC